MQFVKVPPIRVKSGNTSLESAGYGVYVYVCWLTRTLRVYLATAHAFPNDAVPISLASLILEH
jgi:hypothetical protein